MKVFSAAVLAALAAPGAAQAAPLASFAAREVPLRAGAPAVATTHARFDLVGLHWRGPGEVSFRSHRTGGGWSAWHPAAPEAEDLPDGAEGRRAAGWRLGNPWWAGSSDAIQVRTHGAVSRVRSYFVRSSGAAVPPRRWSVAGSPPIVTRPAWRANESIRRAAPRYAPSLQLAVVHHTAGSNSYSRAQSAAIVRAIEIYHVKGNGWDDIGYNFLVDKYGQVFEGRYGGIERNVVGAHAQGFNTGSVGVALLGNYSSAAPTKAALDAAAKLIAWRLDLAHVDPLSTTTYVSGGNPRFPSGVPVFLRTVSGHRDTGFTDCPGTKLYARLGALAAQVQAIGLPKIWTPAVQGRIGGPVRFTARLSSALPWTVTVLDPAGNSVDAGDGESQIVDWTWDSTGYPPGRYTYELDAGDARPVAGVVGGGPLTALSLTAAASAPAVTPNGDGRSDSVTIRWSLSAPAQVTATVLDETGFPAATLLEGFRSAGSYALTWRGSALPDGKYTIELSAVGGGAQARATVPVLLDRTLVGLKGSSHYLSPNGDGKLDRVTFAYGLGAAAHVTVTLRRGKTSVGTLFDGDLEPGPQRVAWDGTLAGVRLPDAGYQVVVSATDEVGTVSQGSNVALDTTPPRLAIVSGPKLRFRLSENAVVRLLVDGKRVVKVEKKGAFHVPHAGLVSSVSGVATDPAWNQSATVSWP